MQRGWSDLYETFNGFNGEDWDGRVDTCTSWIQGIYMDVSGVLSMNTVLKCPAFMVTHTFILCS